jgi:hypothetical protein
MTHEPKKRLWKGKKEGQKFELWNLYSGNPNLQPKKSFSFQYHTRILPSLKMYALNAVDAFHISESKDTYVYDIVPLAAGLAAISSDDSLRLLDPLTLSGAPIKSIRRVNTEVTCLKAINNTTERGALLVCTAGRDGRVCLLDPRTAAKIGEVRTGELRRPELCSCKVILIFAISLTPFFLSFRASQKSVVSLSREVEDQNFSYITLVIETES